MGCPMNDVTHNTISSDGHKYYDGEKRHLRSDAQVRLTVPEDRWLVNTHRTRVIIHLAELLTQLPWLPWIDGSKSAEKDNWKLKVNLNDKVWELVKTNWKIYGGKVQHKAVRYVGFLIY